MEDKEEQEEEQEQQEVVSHASMPGGVLLSGAVWSRLSLTSLAPQRRCSGGGDG